MRKDLERLSPESKGLVMPAPNVGERTKSLTYLFQDFTMSVCVGLFVFWGVECVKINSDDFLLVSCERFCFTQELSLEVDLLA